MLTLKGISKCFGGVQALSGVSLEVREGQIVSIIGANGAGKTTLFSIITGIFPPDSGEVWFCGERIDGLRPDEVCRRGIGRTFQNIRLFQGMSVEENIMVGMHARTRAGLAQLLLSPQQELRERQAMRRRARELAEFFGIEEYLQRDPLTLSYGDQRRVEMARAMASEPRLLLLDEPTAGMSETESDQVRQLIQRLRENGTTILLIEHDMNVVMNISDWIVVLNYGQKLAEGPREQVRRDPRVIEAYLGLEE